jgi:hypothetical protein
MNPAVQTLRGKENFTLPDARFSGVTLSHDTLVSANWVDRPSASSNRMGVRAGREQRGDDIVRRFNKTAISRMF